MKYNNIRDFIGYLSKWVAIDGFLHLLICWLLVLNFTIIFNVWEAVGLTLIMALLKEVFDRFIQKDNTWSQVLHDIICDLIGLILGLIPTWFNLI